MAYIEITYDDGSAARWADVPVAAVDTIGASIEAAIGGPGTILDTAGEPYCNHDAAALTPIMGHRCECGELIDVETI